MLSLLKRKMFGKKRSLIPDGAVILGRLDMPQERSTIEVIKLENRDGWMIRLSGGYVAGVREFEYPHQDAMREGRNRLLRELKQLADSKLSGRYLRNHTENTYRPMTQARYEATVKVLDSLSDEQIDAAAGYLYHGTRADGDLMKFADAMGDCDVFYRCRAIRHGLESICGKD